MSQGNSEQADQVILDAEQFKALIEDPRGKQGEQVVRPLDRINLNNFDQNPHFMDNDNYEASDDAFFHIICHVDPTLRTKIEKGEYVDLEKLLPRNKFKQRSFENRFEWITRDGVTHLAPIERDTKITGIRKWEQAFRVYTAIYSKANPHWVSEIWQYVYVINNAASTFIWDNVAEYDFTFRQLMSSNPTRSWAKMYTQIWNLTLKDHINKFQGFGNSNQSQKSGQGQSGYSTPSYGGGSNNHASTSHKRKSDYCWKFNGKNGCKDNDCKWINCCKYCDSAAHGVTTCPKKHKASQ